MASERKFVTEKIRRVLLKEYVMARVGRAGFGGLDVQRTPMGTRVTLITERPGLVIGRRGEAIKSLTQAIEQDFSFNNPQIEVQEVENPNLNAQIMAEKLASALERGWHFRRAGHSTVRRIMESGARGCQVTVAGKLTGQRHRREKFKNGHIKFCGQPKLDFMERGFASARMKPGTIGVTVQVMHPDARLPDEIDIIPPPEPAAAPVETEAEEKVDVEKVEEERAAEAVEELKKTSDAGEEKPVEAPAKEGEEKKPRKRKKKAEKAEHAVKAPEPPADDAKDAPEAEPAPENAAEDAGTAGTDALEPARKEEIVPKEPVPAPEPEKKAKAEPAPEPEEKAEPEEKQDADGQPETPAEEPKEKAKPRKAEEAGPAEEKEE